MNSSEIIFVEALKDYVSIFTPKAKYVIHSTMKDIEKKLPANAFIRVHRSFIVRLDKIVSIEHTFLKMENTDKEIPIGGNYKEELFNRIKTL